MLSSREGKLAKAEWWHSFVYDVCFPPCRLLSTSRPARKGGEGAFQIMQHHRRKKAIWGYHHLAQFCAAAYSDESQINWQGWWRCRFTISDVSVFLHSSWYTNIPLHIYVFCNKKRLVLSSDYLMYLVEVMSSTYVRCKDKGSLCKMITWFSLSIHRQWD